MEANMNRVDQYFIDKGEFTEEEFREHGDVIRDMFAYKKVELEFALKDAVKEVLKATIIK